MNNIYIFLRSDKLGILLPEHVTRKSRLALGCNNYDKSYGTPYLQLISICKLGCVVSYLNTQSPLHITQSTCSVKLSRDAMSDFWDNFCTKRSDRGEE